MGRPQKSNGQRTRQAILDAALALFSEHGYFGTSLRDIAAAVGIRESALYNYFPGKEALFEALILTDQQSMGERLSDVTAAPITDVRATLTGLASLTLEDFAAPRQQQLFRILMSDGVRLAKDGRINLFERLSCGRAHLDDFMQLLVEGGWLRQADPQLLAMEFISPLLVWRHTNAVGVTLPGISDWRAFAHRHVDQFLQGAAAPPGERAVAHPAAAPTRSRRGARLAPIAIEARPDPARRARSLQRQTRRKRTGAP